MLEFINALSHVVMEKSFVSFGASFLGGVLVGFSPCIYPVIPIFISMVVKASREDNKKRKLFVVLYVLGLSLSFAGLGMFSAVIGRILGFLFNYAATFIVLGNIFILLGLWNLGVIKIPYGMKPVTPAPKALGFFIMGVVSAFFVTPCMVPVLGAVLLMVSIRQDVLFGSFALVFFAMGLSFPLLVVGLCSSLVNKLPRSGRWLSLTGKLVGIVFLVISQLFFIKAGVLLCVCQFAS